MSQKAANRVISFRISEELAGEMEVAIRASGMGRSAWLASAVYEKSGGSEHRCTPESRLEQMIGQMEQLLSQGETFVREQRGISQGGASEGERSSTAKEVIAAMVEESRRTGTQSSNKRIVAALNEMGIRPARGEEWTTSMVDNLKRRMKSGNT